MDRENIGKAAVGEHFDLEVAVVAAVIGDPEEDGRRLGPGDGLDADVVPRHPDRLEEKPGLHLGRRRGRLGVAVAEQHDRGAGPAGDDRVGERKALAEIDLRAGGSRPVEGGVEDSWIARRRRQQLCVLAEENDRHLLPGSELVGDGTRPRDGGVEAAGADVAGLHAGGSVEHHDGGAADPDRTADTGSDEGERDGDGGQQLEKEEQAPPQALPGRVRLAVGHEGAPEHQRRHPHLGPADLQEVEEQDRRQRQQRQQADRCKEAHGFIA